MKSIRTVHLPPLNHVGPSTPPRKNVLKKPVPCRIIQQAQKGNTCWFHTIMGGFLYSKYGRAFLEKKLEEFEQKEGKIKSTMTCPMRSIMETISAQKVYYGIIKEFLSIGVSNNINTLREFGKKNEGQITQLGIKDNVVLELYSVLFGKNIKKYFMFREYSNKPININANKLCKYSIIFN